MTTAMGVECLIIGGGAAGTAAAEEATARGVEVIVVEAGQAPAKRLDGSHLTVLTSSLAWGIFPGGVVSVITPGDSLDFTPRTTILATGAEDRLLPFPGWEHQPVVTAAEAVALARSSDASLRWIVAGNGAPGIQAALALHSLGQDIVLYADASADDLSALRAAGIEALGGYALGDVRGDERLDEVKFLPIDKAGTPVRRKSDFLCVAYARYPAAELAWLAGCQMVLRPDLGGYVPVVRDAVTTTVEGVFAVGAVAGLCREETAVLAGRLAGMRAAERLGRGGGTGEARSRLEADLLAAQQRDAAALAPWIGLMWKMEDSYVRAALERPGGVLCRCEKVPGQQVKGVLGDAGAQPGDVKRATRTGMGECQGRHCRLLVVRAVTATTGRRPEAAVPMTFRPPARPITVADLIRTGE